MNRYYIVFQEIASVDIFIGYTLSEYIVDQIQKNDNLNIYIVYELYCNQNELEETLLANFNVDLDIKAHRLKIFDSKDKTKMLISSERQIDEVILETNCFEDTLLRTTQAIMKLHDVYRKFITDKEVMQFVNFVYINYVCPDLFKIFDDGDVNQLSIDKIKLLAKLGYIGTITT